MQRKATAAWQGGLKTGEGTISTESGALDTEPYGFNTRFGDRKGTNPEELIAAAHAACFSMALSNELEKSGITSAVIATTASVELKQINSTFAITASHLDVAINAKGSERSVLETAAETARANCPVSKLLRAEITMTAHYTT